MSSSASAELKIESVYPSAGLLNQDLEVTLSGTGFDEHTRILMYQDEAVIASADTPGYAVRVEVADNRAYVASIEHGLQIIDISDPANPEIIGVEEERLKAAGVAVSGNTVYVAADKGGLRIIDVSNPHNPVTISMIGEDESNAAAIHVAVKDKIAYVSRAESGLEIIDVSDPYAPSQIGIADTPGRAIHATIRDNTAFVGDGEGGLQIIDISDPRQPYIIGSVNAEHFTTEIAVSGDTAYMTDGDSGLHIVDVSNLQEPRIIGNIDTPGLAAGIAVRKNIAFIGDMTGGLVIVDVSDSESPRIIDTLNTDGFLTAGVKVINDIVYVANSDRGLLIVSAPVEIETVTVRSDTEISLTLPPPTIAGSYTLKVFNESESHEYTGAVRFFESQISPDSYEFGTVKAGSASSPQTFSISNINSREGIEIGSLEVIGENPSEFRIQKDMCSGKSLSLLDNCTVQVSFSPTSAGIKNAELSIPLTNGTLSSSPVTLRGAGYDDSETYIFERMWPPLQQPWYFSSPYGIAIDREGFVYLTDTVDHCVKKFTADGYFVSKWGKLGTRDGEFNTPTGIAADNDGFIYVSDSLNQRIQKFTAKGQFVSKWETADTDDQKISPTGIAADSNFIYVSDILRSCIYKFTHNGEFADKWGDYGTGEGEFNYPAGIGVDDRFIYVADSNNHRIQKFSKDGQFELEWRIYDDENDELPLGVALDGKGFVYLVDQWNYSVQKYTDSGELIARWGTRKEGDKGSNFPSGIALYSKGENTLVYVTSKKMT
jgi:sugar lactone lactonase YvrE